MSTATTGIQNLTPVVKASAAEVTTGTNDTKFVTPLTSQGIRNLRQYLGDGTDFTTTASVTISALNGSVAIPYQTTDGAWRLRFNIHSFVTTGTRASIVYTISGVTFKTAVGFQQCSGSPSNFALSTGAATTNAGTGGITIRHTSGPVNEYILSGDVELDSKPTWAL